MLDRVQLQGSAGALAAVVEASPDETAGVWLEHKGRGTIVVNLAPSADRARWDQVVAVKLPGARVRVEQRAVSTRELTSSAEKLWSARDDLAQEGVRVASVGINPESGRVRVLLAEDSEAARSVLRERYPDVESTYIGPLFDLDSRQNSGGQWKAGIAITRASTGAGCTANFTWKKNSTGTRFIGTAGHCQGNPGGVGSQWYHNANPATGNPQIVYNHWTNMSFADVAMISSPDYMLSNLAILQDNVELVSGGGRGASVTRVETSYVGNQVICKSGAVSGYSCGPYFQSGNVTIDGVTIQDVGYVQAPSACGDSGGPVTTNEIETSPGVWTVAATGVLKGGNGSCPNTGTYFFFSKVARIQQLGYTLEISNRGIPIQNASPTLKCLDVIGGSQVVSTALQQFTCNGNPQQVFYVRPRYGQYSLVPSHTAPGPSEQCADVRGGPGATGNNVVIQQYTCLYPSPTNQRFRFLWTAGYGQDFQLQAVNSGRCIDVKDYNQNNGAVIQQYDCLAGGSTWNQRWHLY